MTISSIPGRGTRIVHAPEGIGGGDSQRFAGIRRDYTEADVRRLRGSVTVRHTLAELGARRLWQLLHSEPYVASLGALTGNQAMQMVRAGLKAIYLSGWQVAADANNAGQMYPDQSLYHEHRQKHGNADAVHKPSAEHAERQGDGRSFGQVRRIESGTRALRFFMRAPTP